MAKTLVFEIEIDEKGAAKSLNTLEKDVEAVGEASKKTSKDVKGIGTSIGSIVKAAGIVGLLVKAFEFLVDTLRQNQTVVDALSTATKAIQIVFNDLVDFALDTVIPTLKLLFNNGEEGAKGFGNALKLQVGGALESLVKGVALATTAIQLFFNGQIKAAELFAKDAAKAFADFGEKAIDTTINYTKEVISNAKALTEAEKASRLLELQQIRLREQYDRDAEQQRQIRDDITLGVETRLEANRKLGDILDKQLEAEQNTVKARIANLRLEATLLTDKQEITEEIYALETELIAIEAQQAGFKSEQLTNEKALLLEQQDIINELNLIGANEFERRVVEAEQLADLQREQIEREVKDAEEKARLLEAVEQQYTDTITQIEKDSYEKSKAIREKAVDDAKKAAQDKAAAEVAVASQTFGAIANIAEEGSVLQKAAAVTQATIDTISGALSAFANTPTGIVGKSLAAAAATAFGLASIQKILSAKTLSAGSTPSAPSNLPSPIAPPPNFTTPDTGINQLGQTITEGINNRPVKAYVVGQDITTQQQLDRATLNNTIL